MNSDFNFSIALLNWYDQFGRKDLPWQQQPTPYHVWLSEIMLQQTQVSTVIAYYLKFIDRFADIYQLAAATQDEVLSYWSGLGYYARARNLHKTARLVVRNHAGELPASLEQLIALPGIGRSTAGAIMTLGYQQRYPILDGNVKRVLTRFYAIDGWPGNKKVENQLWQCAEAILPDKRIGNYIQAQMDLGATLCTRSKPDCLRCPLQSDCKAYALDAVNNYPTRKPKKVMPHRHIHWLVMQNKTGEIFLTQRADHGIWGGLWSFPETELATSIEVDCQQLWQSGVQSHQQLAAIEHVFSHYKLTIYPHHLHCYPLGIAEKDNGNWYKIDDALGLGLPAPVKSFLKSLN